MTLLEYPFYSYGAAILAVTLLLMRVAMVYTRHSDLFILAPFRLEHARLTDEEHQLYMQLRMELDDSLELLCNVPVPDTLPRKLSRHLPDYEAFGFVICERNSGKIRFIAEGQHQSTPEKIALCQRAGIRHRVLSIDSAVTGKGTGIEARLKTKHLTTTLQSPFSRGSQQVFRKVITKM